MAALTLSVNATPSYAVGQYGLSKRNNGNSGNYVLLNAANASGGAGDTIANSEFIAAFKASGIEPYEPIYNLLNTVYTDNGVDTAADQVRKIALALGIQVIGQCLPAGGLVAPGAPPAGVSAFQFACVSGQKPTAIVTTTAAAPVVFAIAVPSSSGL